MEYEKVLGFKSKERQVENLKLEGDVRVALIVPNDYIVASSGLAFYYVQKLLNHHPRIRCERFFYDESFSKYYSLETQTPLDEFPIWLFSVSFENDLLNLLDLLKKRESLFSGKTEKSIIPLLWQVVL